MSPSALHVPAFTLLFPLYSPAIWKWGTVVLLKSSLLLHTPLQHLTRLAMPSSLQLPSLSSSIELPSLPHPPPSSVFYVEPPFFPWSLEAAPSFIHSSWKVLSNLRLLLYLVHKWLHFQAKLLFSVIQMYKSNYTLDNLTWVCLKFNTTPIHPDFLCLLPKYTLFIYPLLMNGILTT